METLKVRGTLEKGSWSEREENPPEKVDVTE